MVHEPQWELYTNLGTHETCILEKVPILLQGQWRYLRNDTSGRREFGGLHGMLSIQYLKIQTKTIRERDLENTPT